MMGVVDRSGKPKRGIHSGAEQMPPGDAERPAQLREILLVRQCRRLVEPFRRQQLGGDALSFPPIARPDARAHERLRRLRDRDRAEAERQAKDHRPLVEPRFEELQLRRVVHRASASIRPRMYPMERAAQVGPSGR